jgi:hypothetical protein
MDSKDGKPRVIKDGRFEAMYSDPRFSKIGKKQQKVEIDDRFAGSPLAARCHPAGRAGSHLNNRAQPSAGCWAPTLRSDAPMLHPGNHSTVRRTAMLRGRDTPLSVAPLQPCSRTPSSRSAPPSTSAAASWSRRSAQRT